MMIPPLAAEPILLVSIDLEHEEAVIKRGLEEEPFGVNLWELWPHSKESTGETDWLFRVDVTVPPQMAGTDPMSACIHTSVQANLDVDYRQKCMKGEPVFYIPDTEARMPGHIYSVEGNSEFFISRYCEFHFDELTKEPDEDDLEDTQPMVHEEEE